MTDADRPENRRRTAQDLRSAGSRANAAAAIGAPDRAGRHPAAGRGRRARRNIAELKANASIKQATGDAESTRLRALGEAQAIRATGDAKAAAYRAGVEALGAQSYTVMQLMQIVGERNVRIVPDVAVNGAGSATGLVDGLLGLMLRQQTGGAPPTVKQSQGQ